MHALKMRPFFIPLFFFSFSSDFLLSLRLVFYSLDVHCTRAGLFILSITQLMPRIRAKFVDSGFYFFWISCDQVNKAYDCSTLYREKQSGSTKFRGHVIWSFSRCYSFSHLINWAWLIISETWFIISSNLADFSHISSILHEYYALHWELEVHI